MAARNVLVSVVGDRDPLNHELFLPDDSDALKANLHLDPGPILETIHLFEANSKWSQQPLHKVWLLFTDDKSSKKIEARVQWLCSYLHGKGIDTAVYNLKVDNPSDYSLLIPSMSLAASHIRRSDDGNNFFVLTSPGTPQMSATWIILGNEGRLAGDFLQKVPGKRVYEGAPGKSKVISRQDDGLLLPISLSPFFEHEKIEQIRLLLTEHLAFSSCSVLLSKVASQTLFMDRVPYYQAVQAFCDILSDWENSNYTQALRAATMQSATLIPVLAVASPTLYDEVVKSLTLLSGPTGSEKGLIERIKNLLARSARSHVKGDFATCVNTAFSAYETLLAGTLQNPPYNFTDFEKGYTQDKEDRLLGERYVYGNGQECVGATPIHAGMKRIKGNPGLRDLKKKPSAYALVRELRDTRNGIVHRNEQVDGKRAGRLLKDAIEVISIFLNTRREDLTNFPYSKGVGVQVAGIATKIAKLF